MRKLRVVIRCIGSIVLLSLFCSCIDIHAEVSLNADGSGEAKLSYKVSRLVIHLGSLDEDNKFFAVPVSRQDFEDTVRRHEGLDLKSFSTEEDTEDVYVDAEIGFTSIEALSFLFNANDPDAVSLTSENGKTTYRQTIFEGGEEDIDEDSMKMIESFFSDYALSFVLTTPASVTAVNRGTFTGRSANLSLSIPEVVVMTEPVTWEVSW